MYVSGGGAAWYLSCCQDYKVEEEQEQTHLGEHARLAKRWDKKQISILGLHTVFYIIENG